MLKTQSLGEWCWHEPMLGLEVGPGGHPMSPSHTGRTWLRVSAYVHLGRRSKGDPSPSYCLISHQTLGRTNVRLLSPPQRKQHPPPGSVWSLNVPASVRFNTRLHTGITCGNASPFQASSISDPVLKNNSAFLGSSHDFKTSENV